MRLRRGDYVLIAALLLLGAGLFAMLRLTKKPGSEVVVAQNGAETARYSLDENREIRIESEDGGYNILRIADGKAKIIEASCPDKICEHMHAVASAGESIICLPNRLSITVEGGEPSGVDID